MKSVTQKAQKQKQKEIYRNQKLEIKSRQLTRVKHNLNYRINTYHGKLEITTVLSIKALQRLLSSGTKTSK